ncbi:unnamed protein product [Larinioides sclopetarius]|uniref:Uncharacterized protein n=1 Tax=Larinioides sclopetarius TaxID=280406 RepID=A0AAV2BLJ7_9ARAC
MKFLILFAVGAFFGAVHCDQECFRAVFKECVREPVPKERMTLCDEIKFEIECLSRLANKCNMDFKVQAEELKISVESLCSGGAFQKLFDEERDCYKRAVNDSECVGPINEAMRSLLTTEEIIKANKRVCNLFEPYSVCVGKSVLKNCGFASRILFDTLYNPLNDLSNSICEQLILPADEKDSRPDNFGMLNVFASLAAIFLSA